MPFGLLIYDGSGNTVINETDKLNRLIYYNELSASSGSSSVTLNDFDDTKGVYWCWPLNVSSTSTNNLANTLSWNNSTKVLSWTSPPIAIRIFVVMYK